MIKYTISFVFMLLTVAVVSAQSIPDNIIGYDPHGIPMTCGTTDPPAPPTAIPGELIDPALPSDTRMWETIPGVIRDDGIDSFRVEFFTNGPVNRVHFEDPYNYIYLTPPASPELRDDGLGQDRVAGDYIFTSELLTCNTTYPMPEFFKNDIHSPSGLAVFSTAPVYIEELDGTTSYFLNRNANIGILRSDIPETVMVSLAPDIAVSPHLINISTTYLATQLGLRAVSPNLLPDMLKRVYEIFPDNFDFLMLFSTYKIEKLPYMSGSNFNAGMHRMVKINYTGTGIDPFAAGYIYGSQGRLLGISTLDAYTRGIWGNNAVHELLHQWSAYIDPALGISSGDHYAPRSNGASLLGGWCWDDNGDGSYTIVCDDAEASKYYHASSLDKYMMGLIDANDVQTIMAYSDQSDYVNFRCAYGNQVIEPNEIVTTVTIEDIISVEGVRAPGPENAQHDFNIAFIAESHEGLFTPTEMTFYEILAAHFTKELAPEDSDPYLMWGWQPLTRYFGEGTTWSSEVWKLGDFTFDGQVNIDDLRKLSNDWMQTAYSTDIAPQPITDGIVNIMDLLFFAQHWLDGAGI